MHVVLQDAPRPKIALIHFRHSWINDAHPEGGFHGRIAKKQAKTEFKKNYSPGRRGLPAAHNQNQTRSQNQSQDHTTFNYHFPIPLKKNQILFKNRYDTGKCATLVWRR